MSCHHPSMWRFLDKLKKEQGLVEVKQAFYTIGRKPPNVGVIMRGKVH